MATVNEEHAPESQACPKCGGFLYPEFGQRDPAAWEGAGDVSEGVDGQVYHGGCNPR